LSFAAINRSLVRAPSEFLIHGAARGDADNDGWADLVQLTGARRGVGEEPTRVFMNRGDHFDDSAQALGLVRRRFWRRCISSCSECTRSQAAARAMAQQGKGQDGARQSRAGLACTLPDITVRKPICSSFARPTASACMPRWAAKHTTASGCNNCAAP
jgi:hypothetical protein